MSTTLVPFRTRMFPGLFEEFDRDLSRILRRESEEFLNGRGFSPSLNLAETETTYLVSMDLPGMAVEDIDIEVKGNDLCISGERRANPDVAIPVKAPEPASDAEPDSAETAEVAVAGNDDQRWHRVESSFGNFRRVIRLREAVDPAGVEAEYLNGVLRVTVPKAEAARPHRIEIRC